MVTDNLIVIRNKYTGKQYAYPASRFSELPTVTIENGEPGHTGFCRGDLISMVDFGNAEQVGIATLSLNIKYTEDSAAISKALGEE